MKKILIFAILIFLFAFFLRLWNLNMMGRWWDEEWYTAKGYTTIELLAKKDFSHPFLYTDISDHPPLSSYFYGLASYADFIRFDKEAKHMLPTMPQGMPIFQYDLVHTRMVSVIISSLSIVLLFLMGVRYFSFFVGLTSAIILAMLPHFLGFSQLVVLESWIMFFFTACAFSYFLYLESGKTQFLILTGILTGLNLEVKQSNILILVLYFVTYFVWKRITKKKNIPFTHFFLLGAISLLTYIVVWPMPWFHLPIFINYNYELWFKNGGLIPELIFGIPMGARSFFYIVAFLVTTPLIIILLSIFGMKTSMNRRKQWIYVGLLIWFFVPFLMMFFHHRQNMVRYIIQFYAPLSLLAALGFESLIGIFTKSRFIKYSLLAPLFVYLMIILLNITPYYLNYFNELVGGTKNVYEKKLFFLGWFGEGLRGPGMYVAKNAPKNAKIGIAINPEQSLYQIPSLHYETFNPSTKYDYVIVNYFNVIRIGFDENILQKDYKLVYTEKADGADLAYVYKRK